MLWSCAPFPALRDELFRANYAETAHRVRKARTQSLVNPLQLAPRGTTAPLHTHHWHLTLTQKKKKKARRAWDFTDFTCVVYRVRSGPSRCSSESL